MLAASGLATMFLLGGTPPPRRTVPGRHRTSRILTCGVEPAVPGFVEIDAQGVYRGLDVDICRAVATAIFGAPDRVRFVRVAHVTELSSNRTSTSSRAG